MFLLLLDGLENLAKQITCNLLLGEEPNKYLCYRSNPVSFIYSQCIYVVQLIYMKEISTLESVRQ